MIRLTKWVFHNKAALLFMVVLALGLGVMSYFSIPREFLPAADNPQISVTVMSQGLDANSLVTEVTEPIEKAVATVKGKSSVYSTTGDGFVKVDLFFDSKTSMKDAKIDVQDAMAPLTFPDGVSKPFVVQLNTSMIPVADVGLSFKDGITQSNMKMAEDDIVPVFQKIPGLASVAVYGKANTQVIIKPDKEKLASHHVPFQALAGVLQGKNVAVGLGDQTMDGKSTTLKVVGNLTDLDALKNMYVMPQVQLKDVATVEAAQDLKNITHVNGKDAMVLIMTKNASSNAVDVSEGIKSTIEQVNKDHSPNVQAEMIFTTADMVVNSVSSMMREVLMGALFATIVILLFLRNIRMTLITIVSIPLSLALTLFLLSNSGVTLNILTLGGVAVAVGRLVDDSIVVIENIYRKLSSGENTTGLILESTKEVASAITSSTLTTVAVFLPMGLVSGSMHNLLMPFALTMTYSLLSSLLVALTVIPVMSSKLLKQVKHSAHKRPERYVRLLRWTLNHKWVPLLVAVLALVGTVGGYFAMPQGAVDQSDVSSVTVALNYPNDVAYDKVKDETLKLEKFIQQQPEVKSTFIMMGNSSDAAKYGQVQSPTMAQFQVTIKDGANASHFMDVMNGQKSSYPGADLSASSYSMMGGGPSIELDLLGTNAQDLQKASQQVIDTVKGIDGVQKVESNQKETKPVYEIVVNPNNANAQEVAMQLHLLTNQTPIGKMQLDGTDTAVVLDPLVTPTSTADLKNIDVSTKTGVVKLDTLATLKKSDHPTNVLRKEGREYVRVSAQVDPKRLSTVAQQIALKTKDIKLPSGVEMKTQGAATQQASDFADLFKTMIASIGIVYLIMVITFKTLRAPLAILFTLPLAAIGAVLGLIVSQTPVDSTSLIGALMLIGIVVTNAIVLLDRVKQNEQTMTIRDALIDAASTRVRPILMTAVATICSMLPLLFGKTETGALVSKGLAVVVISGLTIATLLTLVIVPVIYELLHFKKAKKQRVAAGQTDVHAGDVLTQA
jgi:multidrug efflux pump subunit AcrB